MTAGEAKDRLEWLYEEGHTLSAETKTALEAAIKALEENQKLHAMVDTLADCLDGTPLPHPCGVSLEWCKEYCMGGEAEPTKELWMKWAEVMANERSYKQTGGD